MFRTSASRVRLDSPGNVYNGRIAIAADVVEIDLSTSRVPLFHDVDIPRRRTHLAPDMPALETRRIAAFHPTILNGTPIRG